MTRFVAQLLAYVVLLSSSVYAVWTIERNADEQDAALCTEVTELRRDLAFVLRGAGENERVQMSVLLRVASLPEQEELVKTLEPGLAGAIQRISRSRC